MDPEPAASLGMAYLGRYVFEGGDIQGLVGSLAARASAAAPDVGAVHDLAMLLQMTGMKEQALALQESAIELNPLCRTVHGSGERLRLLALMVPGDLMSNTPLDFLLEGSDVELIVHYGRPGAMLPDPVPPHDVAMVAVSESDTNLAALLSLAGFAPAWPVPVVNAEVERIIGLSRDGVAKMFEDDPHVFAPAVLRVRRQVLERVAGGALDLSAVLAGGFPIIARPIGSHAGQGLEKLDGPDDLARYLAGREEPEFYVSRFIDYSGPDGRFRKLRIAFIDGKAFISHAAISEHWMVHYLNAGMLESEEKRALEAALMASFDDDFAVQYAAPLAALVERVGLDYFAIDCATLPDGRILLFEVDVAMIVHAMDSAELHPYKGPPMRKLSAAFVDCLARKAGLGAA